jgi:predicted DNA-binding antitoxin AbrB/MazE fold protein
MWQQSGTDIMNPVPFFLRDRGAVMSLTIEAVYEDGVLKPIQPLPLQEHERVRITVQAGTNWVQETAGMIKWTGDHETLRRLAEDVEFDPQEGA